MPANLGGAWFYASGNFQTVTSDLHIKSKAYESRIVNTVLSALVALSPKYINFPRDNRGINDIILGFSRNAYFPIVTGAIDGTRILMKAPNSMNISSLTVKKIIPLTSWQLVMSGLNFPTLLLSGLVHLMMFLYGIIQQCVIFKE